MIYLASSIFILQLKLVCTSGYESTCNSGGIVIENINLKTVFP